MLVVFLISSWKNPGVARGIYMKDHGGTHMAFACKTRFCSLTLQGKTMIWPMAESDCKTMIRPISFTIVCMVCCILGNSLSFVLTVYV